MDSRFDFPEVVGRLDWESEHYTPDHPNWEYASTLLVTAQNLNELYHDMLWNHPEAFTDGRKLQHIIFLQGTNALTAFYWLVKNHCYNAAYGRGRYLYETYLIIRRLNHDFARAADHLDEIRKEAGEIEEQLAPLEEQADILHDYRKEERDKIEENSRYEDEYGKVWRMMSNRGSHPATIRSSSVEGNRATEEETSILEFGLEIAFGIAAQYLRTFWDTVAKDYLHREIDQVFVELKYALYPEMLPTFLKDEMHFWAPVEYSLPNNW